MITPRMTHDPEGYYARLGVPPSAGAEAIAAAYRRRALQVHPDVPGTGDANRFLALKQAYDVLIHAERRAAYDRISRPAALFDHEPGEIGSKPFPEMKAPPTRHPRPGDLPPAVWGAMAAVLVLGVIQITLHLRLPASAPRADPIPATARAVPPQAKDEPVALTYGAAPVRLAGSPNFYIVPASSPATLWRVDEARHSLAAWGNLPQFSAVQALRLHKPTGMVEVKVTDHINGFIEAARLTPGDAAAASRAWCTFNSGPTPVNGEVLTRRAKGAARLNVDNRSSQPAVVKIRTAEGAFIASAFVSPGGQTTIEELPDEPVKVDFATGEVWSRACHGFAAGMRAVRVTSSGVMGVLTIPPAAGVTVADLPDQVFEQE